MRPDARGIALVALGCLMQVAGVRADVFALQGWSLLALGFGVTLTFLGPGLTRRLAFPIGYLGFMLTFPPVVMNTLSYALKEVSVALSTRAAEALGVALQRDGMSLVLATGELGIENPCSGLRSLLALLATGTVFALLPAGRVDPQARDRDAGGGADRHARQRRAPPAAHPGGGPSSVSSATGRFHDVTGYVIYAVALGRAGGAARAAHAAQGGRA